MKKSLRIFMLLFLSMVLLLLAAPSRSFATHEEDVQDLDQRVKSLEAEQAKAQQEKKEGKTVDMGGWIRLRYHVSNWNAFGAGQTLPGDKTVSATTKTVNFAESRAMLFINPSFGDYVSGQFGFTTDFALGDEAFGVSGVGGGGLKGRDVNVKTIDVNMTATLPGTNLSGTFGLQTLKDAYNGILLGWPNGAGVNLNYKAASNLNILGSWYRFWQPVGQLRSNVMTDFFRGEVAYSPDKSLDLGFNVYYLTDSTGENEPGALGGPDIGTIHNGFAPLSYNASTGHESLVGNNLYKMWLVWPGVNFAYRTSGFTIDGFAIYQGGKFDAISPGIESVTLSSFAGNLGVATQVGPTHVKLSGIWVEGDNGNENPSIGIKKSGFYTPGSWSLSGAWMGLTAMKILFPDLDATAQDQALVYDVTNTWEQKPLGIKTLLLTSNTPLSEKINLEAGLGALWSDKKRPVNDQSYMSTEINAGIHYRPYKQFSIGLQTAYAWVGDFFKVSDAEAAAYNATATGNSISALREPANQWLVYLRTNYAF
jgi:hypothetical protein